MKLEDLKDTEFNRRYGFEIVSKSNSSPSNYYRNLLNWMVSNDDWITFTVTVTFKNLEPIEASEGYKKAAIYEYEKRVLTKIKKRLCRLSSKWNSVIPIALVQNRPRIFAFSVASSRGLIVKPRSLGKECNQNNSRHCVQRTQQHRNSMHGSHQVVQLVLADAVPPVEPLAAVVVVVTCLVVVAAEG
jgi:hypothetical protein